VALSRNDQDDQRGDQDDQRGDQDDQSEDQDDQSCTSCLGEHVCEKNFEVTASSVDAAYPSS
jgi:hypothetical protein